jgi:hypothetical protein
MSGGYGYTKSSLFLPASKSFSAFFLPKQNDDDDENDDGITIIFLLLSEHNSPKTVAQVSVTDRLLVGYRWVIGGLLVGY